MKMFMLVKFFSLHSINSKIMAWCAAVGCDNYKRRDKHLAFFSLPKNPEIAVRWRNVLKRGKDIKAIFVCEKHFEENCFDPSVDLKNRLLEG